MLAMTEVAEVTFDFVLVTCNPVHVTICYRYTVRVIVVFGNQVHVISDVAEVMFDLVVLLTCTLVRVTIDVADMKLRVVIVAIGNPVLVIEDVTEVTLG